MPVHLSLSQNVSALLLGSWRKQNSNSNKQT
nr:MAG TPA: hypothetical protein [Caudoviricetes sp.]